MEPLRLPASLDPRFHDWLATTRERQGALATRDLRRGIQAVSRVYVEERGRGDLGARATGGTARRAAFACFYAPLHFLTVWHLAAELRRDAVLAGSPRRVVDLGCGTGAVGAAAAVGASAPAAVLGVDALGWALGEARHTYRAFGLRGRTRRGHLPAALPRLREGDLAVCGWFLNECDDEARLAMREALQEGGRAGARVLVVEPLAGRIAPWWEEWVREGEALGLRAGIWKQDVDLPEPLRTLDRAAGLDHGTLGARWLAGPVS